MQRHLDKLNKLKILLSALEALCELEKPYYLRLAEPPSQYQYPEFKLNELCSVRSTAPSDTKSNLSLEDAKLSIACINCPERGASIETSDAVLNATPITPKQEFCADSVECHSDVGECHTMLVDAGANLTSEEMHGITTSFSLREKFSSPAIVTRSKKLNRRSLPSQTSKIHRKTLKVRSSAHKLQAQL